MKNLFIFLIILNVFICCTEPADQLYNNKCYYKSNLNKSIVVGLFHVDDTFDDGVTIINNINDTTYHKFNGLIDDSMFYQKSRLMGNSVGRNLKYAPFYLYAIFNLSDTTSYIQKYRKSIEDSVNYSSNIEIYSSAVQFENKCDKGICKNDIIHSFNINSNTIKVLKKDYSMLERFKEYYQ
jgi:hypothetical protein